MNPSPATAHPRTRPATLVAGFALSHFIALAVTATALVTLPVLATIATYVVLFAWAVVVGGGLGSPVFLPLAVIAVATLGLAATFVIAGLGLVTDALRRAFAWPIWIPPLALVGTAAIASGAWRVAFEDSMPRALLQAALLTAVASAAFALYWIPLAATALALRSLRELFEWMVRTLRERRDPTATPRAAA